MEKRFTISEVTLPQVPQFEDMVKKLVDARIAALESLVREFLKVNPDLKPEDCLLVERVHGTTSTWHVERK
jgi:hypothetical protein